MPFRRKRNSGLFGMLWDSNSHPLFKVYRCQKQIDYFWEGFSTNGPNFSTFSMPNRHDVQHDPRVRLQSISSAAKEAELRRPRPQGFSSFSPLKNWFR